MILRQRLCQLASARPALCVTGNVLHVAVCQRSQILFMQLQHMQVCMRR